MVGKLSNSILYCELANYNMYTLKMLGCFNPTLGQIWTNPNVGLKNVIKTFNPMAGFVHIWPKVGLKQPSILRVYEQDFFSAVETDEIPRFIQCYIIYPIFLL